MEGEALYEASAIGCGGGSECKVSANRLTPLSIQRVTSETAGLSVKSGSLTFNVAPSN
jgi:hypothetical protein